jgi:hypothetical protein
MQIWWERLGSFSSVFLRCSVKIAICIEDKASLGIGPVLAVLEPIQRFVRASCPRARHQRQKYSDKDAHNRTLSNA